MKMVQVNKINALSKSFEEYTKLFHALCDSKELMNRSGHHVRVLKINDTEIKVENDFLAELISVVNKKRSNIIKELEEM